MDYFKESLNIHKKLKGKLTVCSKKKIETKEDLSLLYTPGVSEPCKMIQNQNNLVYDYTFKGNAVAVVTDGSAVLGLGNIGPEAGLPVMEGKCVLFKEFGGIDAVPICLATQSVQEIIRIVECIAPTFGGINLEDISAPRCFVIEEELKKRLNIPVFHDDQHGTAVVALAALINALKIVNKKKESLKVTINGAGSAGIAIAKILLNWDIKNILICDSKGILTTNRNDLHEAKKAISRKTNPYHIQGTLETALKDTDVFIGVSAPLVLKQEAIKVMAKNSIVLALANPIPEIYPENAYKGGAKIVATGRSDMPNQINNVLAFPGIFRGALEVRANSITEGMKIAAAYAIADMVSSEELEKGTIMPSPLDKNVGLNVALSVAKCAINSNIAANKLTARELEKNIKEKLGI
jgi:malate dehydrogenase (oxaloacetate-decarboxylating)